MYFYPFVLHLYCRNGFASYSFQEIKHSHQCRLGTQHFDSRSIVPTNQTVFVLLFFLCMMSLCITNQHWTVQIAHPAGPVRSCQTQSHAGFKTHTTVSFGTGLVNNTKGTVPVSWCQKFLHFALKKYLETGSQFWFISHTFTFLWRVNIRLPNLTRSIQSGPLSHPRKSTKEEKWIQLDCFTLLSLWS